MASTSAHTAPLRSETSGDPRTDLNRVVEGGKAIKKLPEAFRSFGRPKIMDAHDAQDAQPLSHTQQKGFEREILTSYQDIK